MAPVGTARALHLYSVARAEIMQVTVLISILSLLAGVYSVPNVQFGSTHIIGRDTGNIEFFGGAFCRPSSLSFYVLSMRLDA